jgi:spore maturation protein CgeB
MARYGFSPPTRVFEAAGGAECLITVAGDGVVVLYHQ